MASPYYRPMVSQQTFVPPREETDSQQEGTKKKSKRSRNPDNWKKEKRKRAILSGQAYLNTKGELVGPRSIGPDCNCKHRCFINVSNSNRLAIFNGYYSLKSYDEQNAYLYGLIRRYDIQRKRKPVSERRTCSYKYYVRIKGRENQVCKKAFANIHGISDKKIRTLCIKHEQNILFPRDNRGRHNNRPKKVTPELVTLIKHHILKILSGPNVGDFIKTDKNQGPDVNISKLHKSFLQEYQPEAIDKDSDKVLKEFDAKVKSWLYFKVFHEEFNSMDFNTVKRKLSDLKKSLEVSGCLQSKKKGGKQGRSKGKPSSSQAEKEPANLQSHSQHPINLPHGSSMNPLTTAQMGYVGTGHQNLQQQQQQQQQQQHQHQQPQQQQPHQQSQHQHPSAFPHNLQLSMLSLQHLNGNPHCAPPPFPPPSPQHIHPHPLNLQAGTTANIPTGGGEQSSPHNQPLSLNLHSMGGPMSSYYLCFGHVSNLIPLPSVSSTNTSTPGHPPPPHQNHQPPPPNFPSQHNTHQQFPSSALVLPHTTSAVTNSQTNMVNSHPSQSNLIQSYHSPHHTHMY